MSIALQHFVIIWASGFLVSSALISIAREDWFEAAGAITIGLPLGLYGLHLIGAG